MMNLCEYFKVCRISLLRLETRSYWINYLGKPFHNEIISECVENDCFPFLMFISLEKNYSPWPLVSYSVNCKSKWHKDKLMLYLPLIRRKVPSSKISRSYICQKDALNDSFQLSGNYVLSEDKFPIQSGIKKSNSSKANLSSNPTVQRCHEPMYTRCSDFNPCIIFDPMNWKRSSVL